MSNAIIPADALQVFAFNGAEVRAIVIHGEPWWVAIDVCAVLEIKDASTAVRGLDEDEKQQVSANTINVGVGRGGRDPWLINEPGLYALTLKSRKPQAKQFKRWITHEVLPALRKHGTYSIAEAAVVALPQVPDPVERANAARARLEAMGVAKQFRLVNDSYIEAMARTELARMNGEEPDVDPLDITVTCDEFLGMKGVAAADLSSARTRLGKTVAALYRARHSKEPQKIKRPINGVHREVAVYTHRDIDLFDTAWVEVGRRYNQQQSLPPVDGAA